MANPDLFYLSAEEYRDQTLAPALLNPLTDPAVEYLLLEIMVGIDAYIGAGWTTLDDEQEFIFPRYQDTDGDDNGIIPRPVALATRILADALLTRRSRGVLPHEIASESNLGISMKETVKAEPGYEWWPPEVFGILQSFRQVGGSFALSNPDGVLLAREQFNY